MRRFAPGALALAGVFCTLGRSAQNSYEYSASGNPANSTAQATAGLLLHGGGSELPAALEWLARHSGGGDLVILQFTRDTAYDPKTPLRQLVDSVERFAIRSADATGDRTLREKIREAEALWIGESPWGYARLFKNTAVQGAIHHLVWRGVPIAGSGAGAAALGEYSFAGDPALTSAAALADPFTGALTLENGFLHLPYMRGTIVDTELFARDRMGRLVAAMARIARGKRESRGIGIDQATAVLIERDGDARVVGSGAAYFLRIREKPQVCERGSPLTVASIEVFRVPAGGKFNLRTWSSEAVSTYELSADAGELRSSTGSIY